MQARPRYEAIQDRYLVAASLAGRLDAYDELVRRYRGAVILLAWKTLGSREAAQDIAQEVFVVAFQQLNQLKDAGQFGPWIRVIATNRARRLCRRESRSQPVEDEQLDALITTHAREQIANPEEALLRKERDLAIRGLVAALPPGVQMVLELYYSEQWSVAQIAEFLSLTKTTVKWRLHAGRKQVANALTDMMVDADPSEAGRIETVRINQRKSTGEKRDGQGHEERGQENSAYSRRDRVAGGR